MVGLIESSLIWAARRCLLELKRSECWHTSKKTFWLQPFQSSVKLFAPSTIAIMVAKAKIDLKNSGVYCQATWDLTQSPAILPWARVKFIACAHISLEVQSQVNKDRCTGGREQWCGVKTWTNIIILRSKTTIHSASGKRWESAIRLFSINDASILQLKLSTGSGYQNVNIQSMLDHQADTFCLNYGN